VKALERDGCRLRRGECRGGGTKICGREKREQEGSGYRWEMHCIESILGSWEVATLMVSGDVVGKLTVVSAQVR
jgi:hypothetical protein